MPVQVGVRMVIIALLVTRTISAVTAMTMIMMPTVMMTMMTTITLTTLITMVTVCQMMSPSAIPAWIQDQRVQKLLKLRIAAMRTDYYE